MARNRARACSVMCRVSSICTPGASSSESMLRPWSDTGMKVVGISGTNASEATNNAPAIPSVFQRCCKALSTHAR